MKSVMTHQFGRLPQAKIQRSQFDRSHGHKTTFDAGYLIPIYLDEALPGDTFNVRMTAFARMNTPIAPVMDNITMETFFFAVPNRLVWNNWQKFCGEQVDPGDSTDYLIPEIVNGGNATIGSLQDYFGLPVNAIVANGFNALPLRAYGLIWNEWFRDQNLQDSVLVSKEDGPDNTTYGNSTGQLPLKINKRHDYFTSCLPWPQKGEEVTIPLGTEAPVIGIGKEDTYWQAGSKAVYESTGPTTYSQFQEIDAADVHKSFWVEEEVGSPNVPKIRADLTEATAASINALRLAFQVQKIYEKDARSGTRYTEIIQSHFGVTSPDARLQRPEYLGGGKTYVNKHPVAQTSSTDVTSPQGNLAAFATVSLDNHGFTKSFTEHCYIIGLVACRCDLTYQQGMNKIWSRQTRWDFYWPSLANIGEQAVLNKEIYYQNTSADNDVFGYQERWAEYRYKPSLITGQMRSEAASSYDIWHLSQEFGSLPVLDTDFIEENPPMARIMAVPNEPDFIFDSYFNIKCARPMPLYGVPGLIDHF